ncbi:MAG: hypothetical protein QNJ44_22665 [Rhodobacter sp.]|nr:hypothetical protein [Rhodobacter sp.]
MEHSYDIKITGYGEGALRYVPANPGRPETSDTQGKVTVVNTARPGTPAFFEVEHWINATVTNHGATSALTLCLKTPLPFGQAGLPDAPRDVRYAQAEDASAKGLPQMLRQLADCVETANAEADARQSA